MARRPELALLLTVLIWGLNFPVIKLPLEELPAFVVNALRFGFSVFVLGVMHARSAGAFWEPVRRWPVRIALLGLLGYAAYQGFFILGIARTTAGNGALIMASVPIWTALGARLLGVERLPLGAWVGLGIGFVGTLFVVLGGSAEVSLSEAAFLGNMLMLGGAFTWAAYTVLMRPMMDRGASDTGIAFFAMMSAMPILWALGAWEWGDTNLLEISGTSWAAIVFSGLLSTGAAYAWWNQGVRALGPSQAAAWNNLVPVIAVAVGVLLLGETVSAMQLGGGAFILGGLFVMRRARRRVTAPAVPT